MDYPRTVILENDKIRQLLIEKQELVLKGREISMAIDEKDEEMTEIDKKMQEEEKKVDTSDLVEIAKQYSDEFNALSAKMDELQKQRYDRLMANTPSEPREQYDTAKKMKEELEVERNKVGLKIQAKSDNIIPRARKLMQPYLMDEFDDYDSIRLEEGNVVSTIFNHLEDFKTQFRKKAAKGVPVPPVDMENVA